MEHKSYDVASLETKGAKGSGGFEAIVSVIGNVDRDGDRMVKGAFKRTLQPPSEGGRGFPAIVYAHQWTTVPIGVPQKCEEVEGVQVKAADGTTKKVDGLFVDGELFVGDVELASEVYTAMSRKGGDGLPPLREFSFGYRPAPGGFEYVTENLGAGKSQRVRDLKDVDLFEVGPCLVGVNPSTALLGTKGLDTVLDVLLKAGARNSATDAERLQAIHDLATENGATCEGAKAVAGDKTGALAKALAERIGKAWEDIDSPSVYRLTDMIESGTSFISYENENDDAIDAMRGILTQLVAMLAEEVTEQGETSLDAADILEMASLPTSGRETKTALRPGADAGLAGLMLLAPANPRHA